MRDDAQGRCLNCWAEDAERYLFGRSQRVSSRHWWFEPAAEWLRENHPEYFQMNANERRKYRRDKLGWYSRTRQHAPAPRAINTAPPADVIAASVAASHFALVSAAGVRA